MSTLIYHISLFFIPEHNQKREHKMTLCWEEWFPIQFQGQSKCTAIGLIPVGVGNPKPAFLSLGSSAVLELKLPTLLTTGQAG